MDNQSHNHKVLTNFLLSQASRTHRPEANDMSTPPPAYSVHPTTTSPILPSNAYHTNEEAEYEEEEEDTNPVSPLTLHISTPLTIFGTSNLILLPPATQTATKVASQILKALKEALMSGDGIPLVDENGRLRKLDVRIEAGLRVVGTGNVVGERGGVLEELRRVGRGEGGRGESKSERGEGGGERGGRSEVKGGGSRKRRASSAPVGERYSKRERIV